MGETYHEMKDIRQGRPLLRARHRARPGPLPGVLQPGAGQLRAEKLHPLDRDVHQGAPREAGRLRLLLRDGQVIRRRWKRRKGGRDATGKRSNSTRKTSRPLLTSARFIPARGNMKRRSGSTGPPSVRTPTPLPRTITLQTRTGNPGCLALQSRNIRLRFALNRATRSPSSSSGSRYRDSGNYADAAQSFEKSLAADSSLYDAHEELGMIYYRKIKNKEKALQHFEKLLSVKPNHPRATEIRNIISALKNN